LYENLSLTVADHRAKEFNPALQKESHMRLISDAGLQRLNKAVITGRIVPYLVLVMFLVAAAGTAAVQILSPNSFQSLGDAAWWSATTVTTIGYGDVVPATSGGRLIAVPVMFASVATISFTTAVVTASFVAYQQRRLGPETERHQELVDALARIETRLEAIEQKLG
jgi:voltage-gated potassium channel